ncbi:MAG: phenylalanine--tRNA ligase subunit beta [Pseudomonadota bacterium]
MKFTLSWLKQHLETDATLEEILETLTVIGLEVEEVNNPAEKLKDFVIAKVVSAKPHPDADKLKLCQVDTGAGVVQVVCGAHNAREGLVGVFAPVNTYVPGIDLTLKKAKIRGVESNGMLCSERELEISDEHDGIIDLETEVKPGTSFVEAEGLDDPVIEIAITPNRPDCLGVYGIARDLAAAGLGKLTKSAIKPVKGKFDCPVDIDLKFKKEERYICPVFAGRYIKGVKSKPSPTWLQNQLRAIGLRPINALVDITNYISYDRARPLHVYDADQLKGTLHARLGLNQANDKDKDKENFCALDGKTYDVDNTMCIIADDSGVLGFGGIMGGESSGCTEETINVLIESAYFDPIHTAMTGRKTGILSDARYRFERGIDPQSVELGIDLATQMILDICGGTASNTVIAGQVPDPKTTLKFDPKQVHRLTGEDIKAPSVVKMLKSLGFAVEGSDGKDETKELHVIVPSWRPDVSQSADLVEEVIRIYGVNKVRPTELPGISGIAKPVLTNTQKSVRRTRRLLAGRGLTEAVTWSFVPKSQAKLFSGGQDELQLANPISVDMSHMRPSLLAGLLSAIQRNHDRGFADTALFEIGQTYLSDTPEGQRLCAAGLRSGTAKLNGAGRHWDGVAGEVDLFDAKADSSSVLQALGQHPAKVQITRDAPEWYHPGRSGCYRLGPKILLGTFGEIHPAILKAYGIEGPVVGFELDITALPRAKKKSITKSALDQRDLQAVKRDFAFLLDKDTPSGDVLKAALAADKKMITDVTLFDIYQGSGVDETQKSLAIEVTLQPREKTLTDDDIDAVSSKIVAQVKKATGGEIRG